MNGWKDSKENGGVYINRFLGGHRLEQMFRSISASGISKESAFMKLYQKRTSVIEKANNMLFDCIWFVRLLALRPLLTYCVSLG
jgi:hypothetical protein